MKRLFILLYLFALVVIGAAGDGLDNMGVQTWGHLLGALELLGVYFCIAIIPRVTWRSVVLVLVTYICLRIAFFDYTYNLVAGNPLFYMGGSNWWDMFFVQFPVHGVTFARVIFLVTGVAITIKEL